MKPLNIGIKFKNKPDLPAPIILTDFIQNKYEIKAGPIPTNNTIDQPYFSFSKNVLYEKKNKINDGIHILELSSFQLENIYKFKPNIACILNLSDDHLDRHLTLKEYHNVKKNILKNMDKECYFIYNLNDKNFYKKNLLSKTISIKIGVRTKDTNYYLETLVIPLQC